MKGKMPKFIPDNKGRVYSQKIKDKMSELRKKEFAKGLRKSWNKGMKGVYTSAKKGKPQYSIRGINHPKWKGGVTPLMLQIRHSFKTRQWRSDIFTRDNF